MKLDIDRRIFDSFPGTRIGVIVCEGLDNTGEPQGAGERLRAAEAELADKLAGKFTGKFTRAVLAEHPAIAPWRAAYRAFGVTPKKARSSIEAMARRALKGDALPRINPLVDLYNAVSLSHLLPVGGEDLEAMAGDLRLTLAGSDEPEVELLGRPQGQAPVPGEVIYTDDLGAVCRRWNWREARRTCLSSETTRAVLVLDALPPLAETSVEAATAELEGLVVEVCGGRTRSTVLGAERRTFELAL